MLSKFIIICSVLALWQTKPGNLFKRKLPLQHEIVSPVTHEIHIFGKFIQQSANTFPYASQMFKLLNKPLSILSKEKIIHLTPVRLFLTGQIHD